MKTKMISLSLLALAVSSLAVAAEYKGGEVSFKKHAVPSKEMKTAEFGDHYKVETGANMDRQIASEEEVSDREPSSFLAKDKKKKVYDVKPEVKEEPIEAPKPWLYRSESDNKH